MLETFKLLDLEELGFFSSAGSSHVLNIVIGLIMFSVALELKLSNFKSVIYNPKSAIIGLISQFVLLPLITFLFAISISKYITPTVAMGMLLVACCPGGNVSNFITSLSKGNTALSVSLTSLSTAICLIMTPINFAVYGNYLTKFFNTKSAQDLVVELTLDPIQLFITIFIILGIPLFFGILTNTKFPNFTKKILKPTKTIAVILFVGVIFGAISQNIPHLAKYAVVIFTLVAMHNFIAFSTGFGIATLTKLSRYDRRAITIETGIQNSGLALALLFNPKIFPADLPIGGMVFIAAGWGIWHIIGGLILSSVWSKRKLDTTVTN